MYRLLTVFLLSALPALADDTTSSSLIAEKGLTATINVLETAEATPDRNMALAGLRFLSAVELAYQARWESGATNPMLPLPVIGTEIPENPNPKPLEPDFINRLAEDLSATMAAARGAIPEQDGAVVLRLSDLWLDVNSDGKRNSDEDLIQLAGLGFTAEQQPGIGDEIRFDASDAHWLRAYTHLVQAVCSAILAFDPQPELARSIALNAVVEQQLADWNKQLEKSLSEGGPVPDMGLNGFITYGPTIDKIAITLQTLRHDPDKVKINEALNHIHAMIAANRQFWKAVAVEADNDREWIPNDNQKAGLGFELPKGAGDAWLAVLADAEEVLNGDRLIPYWRFFPGNGVDLKAWLDDPQPVDVLDWIQGTAALPYARKGETMSQEGWDQFTRMFGGRAGLYMILFN